MNDWLAYLACMPVSALAGLLLGMHSRIKRLERAVGDLQRSITFERTRKGMK